MRDRLWALRLRLLSKDDLNGIENSVSDVTRNIYNEFYSRPQKEPTLKQAACELRYILGMLDLDKPAMKVLDLGGGSGIYSLAFQQLGMNPFLLDFSERAVDMARSRGVKNTICADFLECDFPGEKFGLVFVKGFSLLNVSNLNHFTEVLERIKACLTTEGVIVYFGRSNFSGVWSQSGWYDFSMSELIDLKRLFQKFHLFPSFKRQVYLPRQFNELVSSTLFASAPFRALFQKKGVTMVGLFRNCHWRIYENS